MHTRQFSSDWKTHWKYAKQIAVPVYLLFRRLLWEKFVLYLTWNGKKSRWKHKHLVCVYVRTTISLICEWYFWLATILNVQNWSVNSFTAQADVCAFFIVCLFVCLLRWCDGCYRRMLLVYGCCTIRFIHLHWISHFKVVLICVSSKQCILCAQWREYHYTNWNACHMKL